MGLLIPYISCGPLVFILYSMCVNLLSVIAEHLHAVMFILFQVFSSREFDFYQRACELKRLSFLVLCCPIDTFQSHLSDLIERIVESLRFEGHPACTELHVQVRLTE